MYHEIFYSKVLALLKGLRTSFGDVSSYKSNYPVCFYLAWESRPSFRHTYQRDKFLNHRDAFIVGRLRDTEDYVILLRSYTDSERLTIYTKAVKYLFKDENLVALQVLQDLLRKFYNVTLEERSSLRYLDYSNGNYSNEMIIHEI